jgi:hypothetical protein
LIGSFEWMYLIKVSVMIATRVAAVDAAEAMREEIRVLLADVAAS